MSLTTLDNSTVLTLLQNLGIPASAYKPRHDALAVWKLGDLPSAFLPWWTAFLSRNGLATWKSAWCCNDFARLFSAMADISSFEELRALGGQDNISVGSPVLEMWGHFKEVNNAYHAINLVLVDDGSAVRFVAIEPQPGAQDYVLSTQPGPDEFATVDLLQ